MTPSMFDVITWRQSVKRWSYSLGNDSVEFLDFKNPENDTNNVVLWYIQQKIEYLTLWRHVWRHHVTSQCQALIVQSWKWFRWISWLQKSRKWHQQRCSMIYTAKDRILDTLTSCVTSSRDVTMSSADRTVLEVNDSVEFLDLKNPENDTNNVVLWYIQQKIEYLTLWRHVWRHHVTSKCQALIVQS